MNASGILATALALGAALGTTGCEDREEQFTRLVTQGPDRTDERVQQLLHPVGEEVAAANERTVRRIAEARCSREQTCGHVGAGQRFPDEEECERRVEAHERADLNAASCPGGIVQKELDECLAAIYAQECGDLFDRAARVVACRSSDMCKAIN